MLNQFGKCTGEIQDHMEEGCGIQLPASQFGRALSSPRDMDHQTSPGSENTANAYVQPPTTSNLLMLVYLLLAVQLATLAILLSGFLSWKPSSLSGNAPVTVAEKRGKSQ